MKPLIFDSKDNSGLNLYTSWIYRRLIDGCKWVEFRGYLTNYILKYMQSYLKKSRKFIIGDKLIAYGYMLNSVFPIDVIGKYQDLVKVSTDEAFTDECGVYFKKGIYLYKLQDVYWNSPKVVSIEDPLRVRSVMGVNEHLNTKVLVKLPLHIPKDPYEFCIGVLLSKGYNVSIIGYYNDALFRIPQYPTIKDWWVQS